MRLDNRVCVNREQELVILRVDSNNATKNENGVSNPSERGKPCLLLDLMIKLQLER